MPKSINSSLPVGLAAMQKKAFNFFFQDALVKWRGPAIIVIETGPEIEPVRPSVRWFTGPTVKNRLSRRFDSLGPDELNRLQILQTGVI